MSSKAIKSLKGKGIFIKPGIFDKGTGVLLPEAYKKFYKEWKLTEPTAVHYIPEEGSWKRDDITGEVSPVQNVPLPLIFPKEYHRHFWGGEGVVQGFEVRGKSAKRVPHFWVPIMRRSVIHSEVLNKYFSVVVTDRTVNLIHANYGLDHYLLKTPACDLKSLLPLGLKRKILKQLEAGCPEYSEKPEIQSQILEKYGKYLDAYTSEEIDWYGYSFTEACVKIEKQLEANDKPVPLKHTLRAKLIEKLKEDKIRKSEENLEGDTGSMATTWLSKVNPFSKKHET